MLKIFNITKQDDAVWDGYGEFLADNERYEEAEEILKKLLLTKLSKSEEIMEMAKDIQDRIADLKEQ